MDDDDDGVCVINGDFPGLLFDSILLLVRSCFLLAWTNHNVRGNVNIKSTGIKTKLDGGRERKKERLREWNAK